MSQTTDRAIDEAVDPSMAAESDFLAIMLRRKWVILFIMGLGIGMGYLAYSKTPALYQSSAQLLVINKRPMMPTQVVAGSEYERLLGENILSTQMMVIRSPLIVRRAVSRDQLHTLTSFNTHSEAAVSSIINGLALTKGGDSLANESASVLNVSFRGPDRQDARTVVDSVIQSYQEFLSESRRNVSEEMVTLITRAKDSLHKDLLDAEAKYNAWRKSMPPNFIVGSSSNIHTTRVSDLEKERSGVHVKLAELRANIRTIEEGMRDGMTRQALMLYVERKGAGRELSAKQATSATMVEQQLFPLMIQEQLLTETLGENHTKVKVVRKQIEVLQQLIMQTSRGDETITPTEFLNMFLDSLRTEVRALEGKEAELTRQFEKDLESAKLTLNYEDEGEAQRAGIERIKRMFDEVMDRLHEINLVQDLGGYEIRVLSEPVDGTQVQPVLSRSLAIGGVLGLILGIGMGYLIDLADKSFRTPDEIRKELRLPVIGHIPVIEPLARGWRKKRKAEGEIETKVDEMAVSYHRPRSTVAEAYRSIRTALYFGTGGDDHKVIQITSADAGDGKTTLALNLAISIAQSGRRVCLVDADFRRSRMHEAFGLDSSVGISSVIQGKAELPDAIHATEVTNLYVLPCGPRPANPSELLTSHRFKELLDMLRSKFDCIILDTPPILAVTDPSAVAPRVDSVLLVLRITKNVRPNALRAKQVLDSLGAKVVGIVVNGVEMRAGYGHESGYRRYAAAGYGHRDYGYGKYYTEEETDDSPAFNDVAVSSGKMKS